ncbi:hypothetical protein M422DRAFT_270247 [Sphaerobolus stellatus SS14]|uniref:CCHC-type domain-containing protein n=1 Tax=Sphaerobolus stellatus (strain SS14) TaxID=990650 RepID=A0A0C9UHQ9_SPHS4|nr:hypothetical protein M422DRAFT_270247 [Sphaerobolus stellatus SS14]
MPTPLRGVSRSNAGNLTLTFKTIADATRARIHADEWIKAIDPEATLPQLMFSIVAHNIPTLTWDGDDLNDIEAIHRIENENSETMAIEFTIAKIQWLNGGENREKTNRGPLMISFKDRKAANAAIDTNMAFNSEISNTSLYIPRAPQCFRCQDWGHRVTECSRESRCGQNCKHSKIMHDTLISDTNPEEWDIILIQEPYIYPNTHLTIASTKWFPLYPPSHIVDKPRVIILISNHISSNLFEQLQIPSNCLMAVSLRLPNEGTINIYNIYNPPNSDIALLALQEWMDAHTPTDDTLMIWANDFNKHNPL